MTSARNDLIRLMSQAVRLADSLSTDLLAEAADIMADIQVPMRRVQCLTWRAGFDPSQPRDESGQWAETGAGSAPLPVTAEEATKAIQEFERMRWFGMAEDVAADAGVSPDKVDYMGKGWSFTVGDESFVAGGSYHPDTGRIEIYDEGLISEDSARWIASHESMHHVYHTVEEALRAEWIVIRDLPQNVDLIYFDGTLKEEYKDQYPIYYAISKFKTPDMQDKLKAKDGVTDYSRAYWAAYNGYKKVNFWTAVNETLAEIAALRASGQTKGVSRLWLSYAKAMREAFALIAKRNQAIAQVAAAQGQARARNMIALDDGAPVPTPHIVYLSRAFKVVERADAYAASIWYPDGRHAYGILAPAGPQARANFDPNQPRDESGQWSDTGAGLLHAGATTYEAELASEKGLPDNLKDKMRVVYDVVRNMGGDPINVDYGGAGYPFTLNGQTFYASASFNRDTFVIEVYDNILDSSETNLKATVAHEQSHYMYERIQEQMEREGWAIDALPADAEVYEADGLTVTPEYADQFPVHAKMYKYLHGKTMQRLKKEDGVSSYSTEYWQELDAWLTGKPSAPNISFDLAINETLAEIAALRMAGNSKAIADIWEQYYADMLAAYAAIKDK